MLRKHGDSRYRGLVRRHPSPAAVVDRTAEARAVLDANWVGDSTVPAPGLYPHQWNWDTGFIALGRSWYDQERAEREMHHLFTAQWRNGMLPHIRFNPKVPERDYFPGANFWESNTSPEAPTRVRTSGITQPPLHAWIALEMHRRAKDHDASITCLRSLFPGLVALHRYIRDQRADDGLAWFLHPWESGLDNSPAWDEAFARVEVPAGALPEYQRADLKHGDARDRPTDTDYDRFVYLALRYRDLRYDDELAGREMPFRVADPMFNAIWARSAHSLSKIAKILGEDGTEFAEDAEQTTRAMIQRLWDEHTERFAPVDLLVGDRLNHHSIVSFMPVLAPGLSSRIARKLEDDLRSLRHCEEPNCYLAPTYEMERGEFDQRRYWRGPLWVNTNWLLYRGARALGHRAVAADLRRAVLELVGANGFREYFDPHGGNGYGADRFSWTAALYLDLMSDTSDPSGGSSGAT